MRARLARGTTHLRPGTATTPKRSCLLSRTLRPWSSGRRQRDKSLRAPLPHTSCVLGDLHHSGWPQCRSELRSADTEELHPGELQYVGEEDPAGLVHFGAQKPILLQILRREIILHLTLCVLQLRGSREVTLPLQPLQLPARLRKLAPLLPYGSVRQCHRALFTMSCDPAPRQIDAWAINLPILRHAMLVVALEVPLHRANVTVP
mmetsp:Transcript_85633/g.239191  ORF Transcript_85633/g.239191 Transcript_85633/m.239191 type:complete len:205 (+) Transcript_85633:409-1023(+)